MSNEVAVVIPAWNAAAFLAIALQSLQQQTLRPTEVVVVDDGSTDGTAAIAEQHGAMVLRQDRQGPAAARNRGVAATRSPLIAFLDADDWFAPAKLGRQVARMVELGAMAVCTDAWIVEGDRVERSKNERRAVPGVLTLEKLLQGNPVICSTMLVRRSALEQAGAFDEAPELVATEDYDLWLRLARREPIAYMAEPLAFYRVHGGSLSANSRFLVGVDRILDKVDAVFGDEPHFRNLVRRRRAMVRLDLAWDLLQASGRGAEARDLIREAQGLAFSWKGLKMWLRSRLRPASAT
ncbi:MAG: glycosyltransferase family 2 protein [Planctomycetota bacterium]